MASTTVEIVSCDKPSCKSEREVQTWKIIGPDGNTREIELCERHGRGVADAFALARALAPAPRPRGRPRKHVA